MTLTAEALNWALGTLGTVFATAVTWAWRINERLTKLEAKHDAVEDVVHNIDEKLDRLIDKLL